MRAHRVVLLAALILCIYPACSDDAAPSDGDGAVADLGRDMAVADMPAVDLAPPDQRAPDQAVPDQKVPDQTALDLMVADQALPDQTALDQMAPDQMVPDLMATDQMVPDLMVPDQMVPDFAAPDQTVADAYSPCSTTNSGWCTSPGPGYPAGLRIHGIWGTSSKDVWIVGDDNIYVVCGLIWHWDGAKWTAQYSNHSISISAVWGSSSTDVFATIANGGGILHYDGKAWTSMTAPAATHLFALWGTGPNNVYAVGRNEILHYDGKAWTKTSYANTTLYDFRAIWGSSASDIWVVSYGGGHKHYDGTGWKDMVVDTATTALVSVWGFGPKQIYAGGMNAIYAHDGTAWTKTSISTANTWTIAGLSATDLYAFGGNIGGRIFHYDGTAWTKQVQVTPPSRFSCSWASAADKEIWLGGWKALWRLKKP